MILHTQADIKFLLSPLAVRERTEALFEKVRQGLGQFELHLDKLPGCAQYVLEVIHDQYPDLNIPFHSRWGHFKVGGLDRVSELSFSRDPMERCRSLLDLAVVSVLLDAGAGAQWRYMENEQSYSRSEGLALASLHMFKNGFFSDNALTPLHADGKKLRSLTSLMIAEGMQVRADNPMLGLQGRTELLCSLGETLMQKEEIFKDHRPGNLVDYLLGKYGTNFKARDVLAAILSGLGDIWPGRIELSGINMGDCWYHPLLGDPDSAEALVPFHKLSQWLCYSLIEPMLEAGFAISGVEELTGLAEYRNGGLFLDYGVISLKDEDMYHKEHLPGDPLIIEWRALTVQLLERVARLVRDALGKSEQEFPLAKVLEGGTWWAGRKLASKLRDGSQPLKLKSDGTVF